MNFFGIILAILGILDALIAAALCRASGEADRRAEELTGNQDGPSEVRPTR